jgi:ABC-type lipoprotein release transport system permease subunit
MPENWPVAPTLLLPLVGTLLLLAALPVLGRVPLSYNLRNLLVRWRTTALTALAFTLVVGLLMVMLAFVNGMNQLSTGSGQPGNVVVLSEGANDEMNSNISFNDAGEIGTLREIVRDPHGQPLCSREVYIGISQPVEGKDGPRPGRRIMQFRGIEDPVIAARVRGVELLPGGVWFSEAGVQAVPGKGAGGTTLQAIEAVVGQDLAREWGMSLGDVFDGGARQWVVAGIMKSTGAAFGSEIWAERQLVAQTFGKTNALTTLVLRTRDAASASQFADFLSHDFKRVALNTQTEKEYYTKLAQVNDRLLGAAYLVAMVIAVGGVFGVMNTMFAAIANRAKDIGVLRILGFRRWQILVSFLSESLLLALAGGLLGCALGLLVHGRGASSFMQGRSVAFTMTVDGNMLAVGLLFALGMGGLGGLMPSLSAMRVRPLEALR